ncbi:hypothetical protein T08_13421 [Trichinella sp. T8]|nr:hypothetical protein T08_13421 [Trichinella sp. T8]
MPYPIPLMKKTVVHQFYSLLLSLERKQKYSQDSICICFVNKLLSGDVQISEKNILAQDTGSNFFQKSRNCKDALDEKLCKKSSYFNTLKVWLR